MQVGACCLICTHRQKLYSLSMCCCINPETETATVNSPHTRAGGSAAASGSGRELDVDAALRDAIRPLLQHTRRGLAQHPGGWAGHAVVDSALLELSCHCSLHWAGEYTGTL
jgi:hypothetical protein